MTIAEFVALALEAQKVFPADAELFWADRGDFDVMSGKPDDPRMQSREDWAPFKRLGMLHLEGTLSEEGLEIGDWEDADDAEAAAEEEFLK